MNSSKFPEREFFFAVMATVKGDYLRKIIAGADEKRFKDSNPRVKNDHIMISDAWLEELTKFPFISSKI